MDKLIPVQGVDFPSFGGKKLHDRVIFPDFSAFQMTIADAASPGRAEDPGAGDDEDPAPEINGGRLNAPPFSWLGSDAWPNFPLWADKPT
ncbi:hypothetical protein AB4Y67_12325 [Arthrobacter sp. YAF17]|uniref:hypothetical protein n=1 Tax=Arthrobacter sp. YAF17 TaxID=3233077 RepID=UPI003F8F8BCC